MSNQLQNQDSPRTKLYILRNVADEGFCMIVEARNEREALERAKEIKDGVVPLTLDPPITVTGMPKRYDVMRLDNGGPMWEGTADTFEDAKRLAGECSNKHSCECWIVDLHASTKHIVKRDGSIDVANM